MKFKWQYLIVAVVFLIWMMACGLPITVTEVYLPTETPAVALTAIKALETLLTPPPPEPTATETPLPTATFTPTVTATNTASPTYTMTSPPVYYGPPVIYPGANYNYGTDGYTRGAGTFYATHLWSMPAINGSWDSIGNSDYSAGYLIYGSGSWTGTSDLNAAFRVGWDNNYLYVAAKVIDDVYVQNASGGDTYKGDSLEVLLDANLGGDYSSTVLNSDDYQVVMSPGLGSVDGQKEAVFYYPASTSGSRGNVIIGASSFSGGYRISAAIPWADFNITPYAGAHYGFALSVSDNDDTTQNVQQSMVSSNPGRKLTNPTTWATLILGN